MPAVGIDRLEYVMDMQEKIIYMKTPEDQLQYIYYHDCRQSYPTHTHASHIVIGCVLEGGGSSSCIPVPKINAEAEQRAF